MACWEIPQFVSPMIFSLKSRDFPARSESHLCRRETSFPQTWASQISSSWVCLKIGSKIQWTSPMTKIASWEKLSRLWSDPLLDPWWAFLVGKAVREIMWFFLDDTHIKWGPLVDFETFHGFGILKEEYYLSPFFLLVQWFGVCWGVSTIPGVPSEGMELSGSAESIGGSVERSDRGRRNGAWFTQLIAGQPVPCSVYAQLLSERNTTYQSMRLDVMCIGWLLLAKTVQPQPIMLKVMWCNIVVCSRFRQVHRGTEIHHIPVSQAMRPGFCEHCSVERHTFAALVPGGKKLRKVEGSGRRGSWYAKKSWCILVVVCPIETFLETTLLIDLKMR